MCSKKFHSRHFAGHGKLSWFCYTVWQAGYDFETVFHLHAEDPIETSLGDFDKRLNITEVFANGTAYSFFEGTNIELEVPLVEALSFVV